MLIFLEKCPGHPTKPINTTNNLKFNNEVTLISFSIPPLKIALLNSIFDHAFSNSSFDFRENQVATFEIKLKILFLWNKNIQKCTYKIA